MRRRFKDLRGLWLLAGALMLSPLQVAAQDVMEGTILAFDRKARVLVLSDKSVWPLEYLTSTLPADLTAGDRVQIRYDSNEDDGLTTIHSISLLPE